MIFINIYIKTIFSRFTCIIIFSQEAELTLRLGAHYGPASTTTTTVSRKASVRRSPYSKKRPSRRLKADVSSASSAADDTTPCCVCAKCYNEPPVDSWTQCPQCCRWFHDNCGPTDTTLCYFCLG